MNRKIAVASSVFAVAMIIMLVLSVFNSSCGSGNKTTGASNSGISFSKDIQPIFNGNCVVCHAGAGQAGLTLEPSLSYSKLVGVSSTESATELRVKAGSPDQSYLIAKLTGKQVQAGGSGAQMPLNASPLAQAQIDKITQWISAGALNN